LISTPPEHEPAPRFERMKIESVAYGENASPLLQTLARALGRAQSRAAADCVDKRYFSRQALLIAPAGGSPAMPAFAKNPKFIIGTIVVLWVA